MIQNLPAYMMEAQEQVLVAWCTVCYSRTIKPRRAMLDRHHGVISDGCGDCSAPTQIEDDGLGPVFIVHGNGTVIRGWGDLTPP